MWAKKAVPLPAFYLSSVLLADKCFQCSVTTELHTTYAKAGKNKQTKKKLHVDFICIIKMANE